MASNILRVALWICLALIPSAAASHLLGGANYIPAGPPIVNGWSVFTDTDGTAVYVSSSTGSDSNNGLSAGAAKQTLAAAMTVLNALTNFRPHRFYLKAGDTWTNEVIGAIKVSGRSGTQPLLVTSYGSGARPLVKTPTTPRDAFSAAGGGGGSAGGNYVAIVGIEFYSYTRNPADPGYVGPQDTAGEVYSAIHWTNPTNWVLIEDCKFSFFTTAVVFEIGAAGYPQFRRNVIVNQYAGATGAPPHSQGVFIDNAKTAVFQENIFDHNGWLDVVVGGFNHNIYYNSLFGASATGPVSAYGNIFANDSSGVQFRAGGVIVNNTFMHSPYGHNMGFPGTSWSHYVTNNVHLDQVTYPSSGAVGSVNVVDGNQGGSFVNFGSARMTGNIFANKGNGSAPAISIGTLQSGNTVTGNIVFSWGAGITDSGSGNTVTGNLIDLSGVNTFGFLDPTRTVATYDLSLGGPGTMTNFLTEARLQSKANWRPAYTASALNDYIRAGFIIP